MSTVVIDPATEVTAIEEVKPLKLSEAMRLGSLMTTQAIGAWSTDSGAMCAMSTAWYALTGHRENDAGASTLVNLLGNASVIMPVGPHAGEAVGLDDAIVELNDTERWSREQIADWLEDLGL